MTAAYRDLELEAGTALGSYGSSAPRARGGPSLPRPVVRPDRCAFADGPIDRVALRGLARAFGREHERTYGYAPPHEPVELANVRLVASPASQSADRPSVALLAGRGALDALGPTRARRQRRRAWFGPDVGWLETPLLDRRDLTGGRPGPFIVEEYDATILVPPGCSATTDENGLVTIEVGA